MCSIEMRRDDRQSKDSLATFREYMCLERRREAGLSPADLRRWLKLRDQLESVFGNLDAPDGRQLRSTPRVPTCLEVCFENLRQLGSVLMSNMSRGGIFVPMDEPPPIGTELELRIRVVSPARAIVLCGEVASLHVGPGFEVGKRGMGICFKNLSLDERAMVDELYEEQVVRHLAISH